MLRHCQVSGGEPEQITSAIKLAECMAKLCESLTQQEFTDMVLDVHEATKKPWLWLALLDNMVSGDIKKTNNEFLILALAHNLESDPIKSHPDIQRRIARLSHRRDENTKAILAGLRKETPTDNAATDGFDPPPLTMDDF
jgi:FMN phosphatase YigB (HAD superfamily)